MNIAAPALPVEIDTLPGTLDCGSVRVANATMGKHRSLDPLALREALLAPNDLLRISRR